jgi:hypothetical protein
MEMAKRMGVKVLGLCLVLTGCAGSIDESSAGQSDQESADQGTVELALTTVGKSGDVYRLRYATFDLTGPQHVRMSTREDLATEDGKSLETSLLAGRYEVSLEPGWQLLRVAKDGTEQGVDAVVTSLNPQALNVRAKETNKLSFAFRIATGDDLAFGDAEIGITVDEPTPGTLFSTQNGQLGGWFHADPSSLWVDNLSLAPQAGSLAVSSSSVYVATILPRQILRFAFDGRLLGQYSHTDTLRDVTVDPVRDVVFYADVRAGGLVRQGGDLTKPGVRMNVAGAPAALTIAYDVSTDRLYYALRAAGTPYGVWYIERPGSAPSVPVRAFSFSNAILDLTVDVDGALYWVSENHVYRARPGAAPTKLFSAPPGEPLHCIAADAKGDRVFVGTVNPAAQRKLTSYSMAGVKLKQIPVEYDYFCGLAFVGEQAEPQK